MPDFARNQLGATKMTYRFIVSSNLPPKFNRQGYTHEVVDSTHPSDGGPVAISWHYTETDAEQTASALNLHNAL